MFFEPLGSRFLVSALLAIAGVGLASGHWHTAPSLERAIQSTGIVESGPVGSRLPRTFGFETGHVGEWTDGFRDVTGVQVVKEGAYFGYALRSPIIQGTTSENYGDFLFGDHVAVGGPKVEEIWCVLFSKFEDGYVWPDRAHKIAMFNLQDKTSNSPWLRRFQVILAVDTRGRYFLERSNIGTWQFEAHPQNVSSASYVRLGVWDKVKFYVKLNTPGSRDGVLRMWVNDVLKLQHTNVVIREHVAGVDPTIGMNKFILSTMSGGSSPGHGAKVNSFQWHDEITISTTDPDREPGVWPVLPGLQPYPLPRIELRPLPRIH
jgi:hypothetical protein